jgi:hypothetical protein
MNDDATPRITKFFKDKYDLRNADNNIGGDG